MRNQRELVEQLFEAALALKPLEREAFLDEVCGDDLEMKRMVEELLEEDARAGSFLQHSPLDFLDEALRSLPLDDEITHPMNGDETSSTPVAAGRLKAGQILIDRFVIVRFIAKGGMGEVYEAEDSFLQNVHVALKTILPHIADDVALQQRFQKEVLLAREIAHPNLCPIYDIFRCEQPTPGFLFLTMKLLPGETLAARLRAQKAISIEEGVAILKQTAVGLEAIHHANIVHRDIKPNNLMLDGAGPDVRLWITDFGLARAFEAEPTLPGQTVVAGTPAYMAPEQLLGYPPSQSGDLYAFGVVLHEVFTGKKPALDADGSTAIVSPELISCGAPEFCVQLVTGCLDKDPRRRREAFQEALESLSPKPRKPWTRRQFLGVAAAGVLGAGSAAWWKRDSIEDVLHPLPSKRFVALLNWPKTSDSKVAPMLTGALNAIKSELARVEAFDRNLFVISPEDAHQDVPADARLSEICDPLGANLVLAASGAPGSKRVQLILRLLNPLSDKSIRERDVECSFAEITSLPGKAVQAAARLLDVSRYLQRAQRTEPGTQSTEAYVAFQSAETSMKQPNDTGLDAAINKYKEATDLDPHYALAHAKLALAYGHSYGVRRDPGALDLARANAERARMLDAGLVDAYLALAGVLELTGDEQGALDEFAKALVLDPSNPKTLLWQAQLYTRLNRWPEAEHTYERVLRERPNSWVTYNELGFTLHKEGKYQKAMQAFRAASLAAPGSSMALSNLGEEYLQLGEFSEATETLKKSLQLDPGSDQALADISLALRYQGKYEEALPFALKAVALNPAEDTNWLELGDCYSSLHNRLHQAKAAYQRAAKEAERHLATDASDGPSWMLLALYQVKSGSPQNALFLIRKAEALGAGDMDSQLYKARTFELLDKRDDALATLADCFQKGASPFQIEPFPDMQSLRRDPRYQRMLRSNPAPGETNRFPGPENA